MENSPLEGNLQHALWQQRQIAKCAGKPVRKTALEETVKSAPEAAVRPRQQFLLQVIGLTAAYKCMTDLFNPSSSAGA